MQETKKSNRGFASIDPEKQRLIARKGGQSVPDEKRSFSQNPELAASAGRKGGETVDPSKRSFLAITRLLQRPVGKAAMPLIALPSRDQLPRIKVLYTTGLAGMW